MTQNKISLKDKQIVKERLSRGISISKSIEGTNIRSTNTAFKISKDNKNDIATLRQSYLLMIEQFGSGLIDRAKLWSKMTKATKLYGKNAVEFPDWQSRAEALKYIDSLQGINVTLEPPVALQINFNNSKKDTDKSKDYSE